MAVDEKQVDEKRLYCAFYTKSDPIVQYMMSTLNLQPDMRALEPAAGDGVLVDALLAKEEIAVDAYELNPEVAVQLSRKYRGNACIRVHRNDALLDTNLDLSASVGGNYDLVVANPPYGAWQTLEKRKALKKVYPGLYVKETYTLFLYRCITLLKAGGQLTFIVPDTFLNLHRHTALREYLLTHTKIREIALFPSSFFPGVNFGYANLCIISLVKHESVKEALANEFRVVSGFQKVDELVAVNFSSSAAKNYKHTHFTQEQIYNNPAHALYIANDSKVSSALTDAHMRLEDIADCVTGFYSGDDQTYIRELVGKNTRYKTITQDEIFSKRSESDGLLEGLSGKPHFLPILKGGSKRFYKPTTHYIKWSKEAVAHYKKDKKARFQNSQYYFRQGIGIPMVSSSKISAALIDKRLFDQGIVGIFPKDQKYLLYLLAFFNSSTCNKLVRTINPSANNSANYLKKLPIQIPTEDALRKMDHLMQSILRKYCSDTSANTEEEEVETLIRDLYGF